MKVKSESEVVQSCLTLSNPMDCSPPGFSIHGIFQARVLEWGAIAFSIIKLISFYLRCQIENATFPPSPLEKKNVIIKFMFYLILVGT